MSRSFEVIVVGSGPGGYVAAIRAAQLGMRTAIVEKGAVGGRCLNYACMPAKAILRSADVLSEVREAGEFGITTGPPEVNYPAVIERRQKVLTTLTGGVGELLKKGKIEVIAGAASLPGPGVVVAAGESYEAGGVILATGSVRRPIPEVPFGGRVIGTEEAWALGELPGRIAVVGAGASGAEVASAFARLGTKVLLLEAFDRVLPNEDADICRVVERGLKRQGVAISTGISVEDVETGADSVAFSYGGQRAQVDWLIIAAGRDPDVEALGLAACGIELDERGLIAVDGALRTTAPRVWAVGDLVAGPALAHKASEEGIIAAEDAAGLTTHPLAHGDIPRSTFCRPNVASVGLTEAEARDLGYEVVVGKLQYGAVGAGTVYGDRGGLIKVVGERRYGELLGGHIVGSKATDLIQELVNVKSLEAGYSELARIVHGHPTLSEGVMEAARAVDGWLIHG